MKLQRKNCTKKQRFIVYKVEGVHDVVFVGRLVVRRSSEKKAPKLEEQTCTTDYRDFEYLRLLGFSEFGAARLIYMKSHLTEEVEYRERIEESRRLAFLRWLIEHERVSG